MSDPLRDALADALEGLEDMIGYVPEYFREKWEHQGYVDRARAALAAVPPAPPDREAIEASLLSYARAVDEAVAERDAAEAELARLRAVPPGGEQYEQYGWGHPGSVYCHRGERCIDQPCVPVFVRRVAADKWWCDECDKEAERSVCLTCGAYTHRVAAQEEHEASTEYVKITNVWRSTDAADTPEEEA